MKTKKNKKFLKESFDSSSAPYIRLYPQSYIGTNGNDIIKEYGYYGSFLVESSKSNKIWGVLFKAQGSENGVIGMKCFVYSYPQHGMLDGKTLYLGDKNFGAEIDEFISANS